MGSIILDWAEDDLEELEIRSGHRSTGNGDFMATETIQTILVAIVSGKRTRTSANEYRNSQAGPNHGSCQRALGRTANPWGTYQTGLLNLGADSLSFDAEATQRTIPNLEDFSE